MALLGINQFRRVGLRFVCWFYDGNTQKLTESGFMEKPGIEPVTPGLQDRLLPYTTAAFRGLLVESTKQWRIQRVFGGWGEVGPLNPSPPSFLNIL